mmetsp:Transcript_22739/g.86143  ORF Transcript_22739/g.86143 Transcript_22739/m.86143 type:complete len:388 (+) Transcript_22739:829-1992(+)
MVACSALRRLICCSLARTEAAYATKSSFRMCRAPAISARRASRRSTSALASSTARLARSTSTALLCSLRDTSRLCWRKSPSLDSPAARSFSARCSIVAARRASASRTEAWRDATSSMPRRGPLSLSCRRASVARRDSIASGSTLSSKPRCSSSSLLAAATSSEAEASARLLARASASRRAAARCSTSASARAARWSASLSASFASSSCSLRRLDVASKIAAKPLRDPVFFLSPSMRSSSWRLSLSSWEISLLSSAGSDPSARMASRALCVSRNSSCRSPSCSSSVCVVSSCTYSGGMGTGSRNFATYARFFRMSRRSSTYCRTGYTRPRSPASRADWNAACESGSLGTDTLSTLRNCSMRGPPISGGSSRTSILWASSRWANTSLSS